MRRSAGILRGAGSWNGSTRRRGRTCVAAPSRSCAAATCPRRWRSTSTSSWPSRSSTGPRPASSTPPWMRSRAMSGRPDELDWIAALRPLAASAPALGLLDDAAVLPSRPGFDLVISEDAMVEGVHFLPGEAADVVARRLLRTNLSDLAAKAAEPFGYLLMTAWPAGRGAADREAFAGGLAEDGERFGLALLGGDTVSTPGPLTVSATILGWA